MNDFFSLFGLPATFAIDASKLDRAYREVQAKVHPDRFANASDAERRVAMQWATQANEAHRTLRDPLRRARYLVELDGGDPANETDTRFAPDFLMRQLEWREALQDARANRDEAGIARIAAELDDERAGYERDALRLLDTQRDVVAAAELVRRWMFVARMLDEVDSAQAAVAE